MPAVAQPTTRFAPRAVVTLLVVMLASLGLTGLGAVTAHPAAATTTTALVSTSVHASSARIDYDRRANVVIRVDDATSHALGGVRVRIYKHTASGDVWVTRVTTDTSTLVAHFRPRLRRSTTYLLVFPGNTTYARSTVLHTVHVRSFGASLVHVGSKKKGSPYEYGAAGPYRFDCSGFTLWVAARFGKSLAHNSDSQYGEVRHIAKSNRKIGDLIFFHDSSGYVYHVGFYAGNGEVLAATHTGDYVRLESLWTSSYYVGRLTP